MIPAGFVDPAASWVVPAASGGFARAARPFSVPFCWSPCLLRFLNDISLSYNFNVRLTVGVLGRVSAVGKFYPRRRRSGIQRAVSAFWNNTIFNVVRRCALSPAAVSLPPQHGPRV